MSRHSSQKNAVREYGAERGWRDARHYDDRTLQLIHASSGMVAIKWNDLGTLCSVTTVGPTPERHVGDRKADIETVKQILRGAS